MSLDLKDTEANFSPNSTDSRCLRVAQMPRSRDTAIFMLTTTTTRPITLPPCACTRGNNQVGNRSLVVSSLSPVNVTVLVHPVPHGPVHATFHNRYPKVQTCLHAQWKTTCNNYNFNHQDMIIHVPSQMADKY